MPISTRIRRPTSAPMPAPPARSARSTRAATCGSTTKNRSGGKAALRGGSFYLNDNDGYMRSQTRYDVLSAKWPNYGFRVGRSGWRGHDGVTR